MFMRQLRNKELLRISCKVSLLFNVFFVLTKRYLIIALENFLECIFMLWLLDCRLFSVVGSESNKGSILRNLLMCLGEELFDLRNCSFNI